MQYQSSTFRTWHRWLGIIVGVQMVIWAISGAYMVFVQLPFIHGEHLTQEADEEVADSSLVARLPEVLDAYPHADKIELVNRRVQSQPRACSCVLCQRRAQYQRGAVSGKRSSK